MKRILIFAFVSCFFFSTVAFAGTAGPNYQEGLWEITTTMNIPGMPKEMNQPHVYKTCLDKKNAVPQPEEKGEKQCEMKSQKISGNTVTWTMTCKNDTTMEGKITYAKTSYEGFTTTTTSVNGKKMTMKSTMKGKYVGPCPK
jgi:hypothetical protein